MIFPLKYVHADRLVIQANVEFLVHFKLLGMVLNPECALNTSTCNCIDQRCYMRANTNFICSYNISDLSDSKVGSPFVIFFCLNDGSTDA